MTSKKGSRHSRYSKTNTQTSKATTQADQAIGSSSTNLALVDKDTTSSNKASASTSKATTPTNKVAGSSSKDTTSSHKASAPNKKAITPTGRATASSNNASAFASKSKRPASKATTPTGKTVMSSSDFSHMRRRFYIVRPKPNKTCVPMIALDELPAGFRLKGVPLAVTPQQINEWDMARVGADVTLKGSFEVECDQFPPSQQGHQLSAVDKTSSSLEKTKESTEAVDVTGEVNREDKVEKLSKPDVSLMSEKSSNAETLKAKTKVEGLASVLKLHEEVNESVHGVVEKSKWEKENDHSKTQDAATPGVFGKKKYCTHWIRTGNCDYMQEGCRYLHVIPDAETRLTIGIRDMPRWAKEDLPSPPRNTNPLRRRSWSPPKENRDSKKDWRSRGNRKAHAELQVGPPLVSRVASERPSTPTPQSTFHGKQYRPQQVTMENGSAHAISSAQGKAAASHLPNMNHKGGINGQDEPNIAAPRPISIPVGSPQPALLQSVQQGPNSQASFLRQQQFSQSMPPIGPRAMQPPPEPSSLYSGFSSLDNETHPFAPPYDEGNYHPFQSHQSPRGTPFDNSNFRNGSQRWGQPPHSPFGMNTHHYAQPHPMPAPGSPFGNVFHRGPFGSPAPSFSEASVGTIGHGRPSASPSIMGSPILHKRLFRQPGESQYVQAKALPSGIVRSTDAHHVHKGKGMTAFEGGQEVGGRSGELGNLIALDEEGNFGGN